MHPSHPTPSHHAPAPPLIQQVVNTDISPVVIAQMRADAAACSNQLRTNCSWEVADCRAMPQYADDSFGTVVDKGTLDAVLCSGTGLGDARCYVSETHRVLAPGGAFLLISLGQPETRLSVLRAQPRRRRPSSADAATMAGLHLTPPPPPSAEAAAAASLSARLAARFAAAAETAAASAVAAAGCAGGGRREVRWARVLVYLLPKPSLYLKNEASLTGRRLADAADGAAPRAAVGKDEPVAWLGPFEVGAELEAALAAPGLDARDYFYCYKVCVCVGGGCLVWRGSK
jgi:SAM-dependent methyltransferase